MNTNEKFKNQLLQTFVRTLKKQLKGNLTCGY